MAGVVGWLTAVSVLCWCVAVSAGFSGLVGGFVCGFVCGVWFERVCGGCADCWLTTTFTLLWGWYNIVSGWV